MGTTGGEFPSVLDSTSMEWSALVYNDELFSIRLEYVCSNEGFKKFRYFLINGLFIFLMVFILCVAIMFIL